MTEDYYTCSECGKKFTTYYLPSVWPWKVQKETLFMQCDYNCHNHATLRLNRLGYMTIANFKTEVNKSETLMKEKGKTIVHPINIAKVTKGRKDLY